MALDEACVVADTGPLLALARLDGLPWLAHAFNQVLIPESVWAETQFYPDRADAEQLRSSIPSDPRFEIRADVPAPTLDQLSLGLGERSAIGLALQTGARVLLDDRDARTVARGLGLKLVGTLGVLLLAKRHGQVGQVAPLLRKLRDSGYFLSEALIRETLRAAGET
ncbi:DUF3368 domain-containing protein [Solimonas sp. K1W22B-7]|uniref:DUF3368 domain-containing protein n=1 Tax=Solimonas sp. K1W22B-7 TaxID=2303331 RepID=UPI0013C4364C|nr:DUF3368 domain-containing protein [Solimonas sp. K1W22B-7]